MIKSRLGRVVGTAVAAVAVTGVMQVAGASAAPAPVRLTIVGGVSDTTQGVMGAVTSKFDSSSVAKSANVVATNVPPVPGKLGKIVPSDANCNGGHSITYIAGPNPGTNERTAPDSDAAGETALATSVTDGDSCTSIARAPLPDPTTDPAGTQAWAYAVDDLTWIRSSNTLSPPNLTMKEIEGVYDCKYLHWHQLGGKGNDMPTIGRYFPPEGSAAATFYSGVLGFDPYVLGGNNACGTPPFVETGGATGLGVNSFTGIGIYSTASWIAQRNGVVPNLTRDQTLGSTNRKGDPAIQEPNGKWVLNPFVVQAHVEPAAFRPTSNDSVQGVVDVFNFINANSVDFTAASSMVGPSSALCNNEDRNIVAKYGFHPLEHCLEQS